MQNCFKKTLCFLLAALFCVGLFGCSKKAQYTPYGLCQEILSLCDENAQFKSLNGDQAATYYGLSKELLQNFAAYVSDDDTSYDAIAVFTFKNEEEKSALASCFKESIRTNKVSAGVVNTNESTKVEKGIMMELQNMLIFVMAENTEEIGKKLSDLGAKNYSFK